MILNQFFDTC